MYLGDAPEFNNEPTWVIDPLDGTVNFVHGKERPHVVPHDWCMLDSSVLPPLMVPMASFC